jgi:hypothetical protein
MEMNHIFAVNIPTSSLEITSHNKYFKYTLTIVHEVGNLLLSWAFYGNHERTLSEMILLMDGSLDEASDEKVEIFDGSGLL